MTKITNHSPEQLATQATVFKHWYVWKESSGGDSIQTTHYRSGGKEVVGPVNRLSRQHHFGIDISW